LARSNKAQSKVKDETLPDLRDADDLHDFMQTVVALPESILPSISSDTDLINNGLADLKNQKRIARALVGDQHFWLTAEKKHLFDIAYPQATLQNKLPLLTKLKTEDVSEEKARVLIVQGWLSYLGPIDPAALADIHCLPRKDVSLALLALESAGAILRGHFLADQNDDQGKDLTNPLQWQWCDRRLLARIHRLTLNTLRKRLETIPALTFMRWLTHWQHAAPGTQLNGEAGVLSIISQLQGLEIAANAWEKEVFKKRLNDYDPALLDHLCLTGSIGWGRLSAHPAFASQQSKVAMIKNRRTTIARGHLARTIGNGAAKFKTATRVIPTSVAPIAFFVRAESDWLSGYDQKDNQADQALSDRANSIQTFLKERGASFFGEITRGTGLLKSEVEEGLWELVTAGLVTADGFDNLRALIDPARRAGRGKRSRPRDVPGRWSLLHTGTNADRTRTIEATCRVLLARYGLVFRELLQRETFAISWRELLQVFRLMEERGEVRGGRFVDGFLGEQFASPEALESLRAFRNRPLSDQLVALSAADPLNLTGLILPGERIPSIAAKSIAVHY
jgi:ATP-dependent Lhr-like helicase